MKRLDLQFWKSSLDSAAGGLLNGNRAAEAQLKRAGAGSADLVEGGHGDDWGCCRWGRASVCAKMNPVWKIYKSKVMKTLNPEYEEEMAEEVSTFLHLWHLIILCDEVTVVVGAKLKKSCSFVFQIISYLPLGHMSLQAVLLKLVVNAYSFKAFKQLLIENILYFLNVKQVLTT